MQWREIHLHDIHLHHPPSPSETHPLDRPPNCSYQLSIISSHRHRQAGLLCFNIQTPDSPVPRNKSPQPICTNYSTLTLSNVLLTAQTDRVVGRRRDMPRYSSRTRNAATGLTALSFGARRTWWTLGKGLQPTWQHSFDDQSYTRPSHRLSKDFQRSPIPL